MRTSLRLAALAGLAYYAHAVPQAATTPTTTGVPTVTISTSVASPTVPLSALVPSQAALPPVQPWCIGQIFCPGAVSPSFVVESC
jgi:alpha,alpha-trehalase